jgi:hypothetical protein
MAILMLFNEFENMTVEKMLDTTQIESELFGQVLLGLLKSKVLICLQINPDELNDDFKVNNIELNYTIQVDESFKRLDFKFQNRNSNILFVVFSKKMKINLNQPIKAVEQKESDSVNQSIEEDRKILIQVNRRNFFVLNYLI